MKLFSSDEEVRAAFVRVRNSVGVRFAPVSPDIPLLSNLSVFQNIALIQQYHERLGREEASSRTTALLERFDLCHLATRRPYELGEWDLFLVKLLRASQVKNAVIVIDRPFVQVGQLPDAKPIRKALDLLDFPGIERIILGYEWERTRYEADDI